MEADMKKTTGFESLTPAIIKFPFEQIMKSFVNLRLGRKKASSVAKILAAITGVVLAYNFPQIGEGVVLLLALLPFPVLNVTIISGLTLACSMLLTSALLIYLVKKTFQYYYENKYGFSNCEQRLTDADRKYLAAKFEKLPKEEFDALISKTEKRIAFLGHEIRKFKSLEQEQEHKDAKEAMNGLKKGDQESFQQYYNEQIGRKFAKASSRAQQLAQLTDLGEQPSGQSEADDEASPKATRVSRPVTRAYGLKKQSIAKPRVKTKPRDDEDDEIQYDIFGDVDTSAMRASFGN